MTPELIQLCREVEEADKKATKNWTLAVKSFTAPVEVVSAESDTSMMRKFGLRKGGDALAAGAEQAEALAKVIRQMRGPGVNGQPGAPLNLEAFVLHTRSASLVTIGQFDGPDDPALHATSVVVLTTSNEERDKVEAYELNVAGYLLKPVTFPSFVDLMAALNKYWTLVEMP